MKRTLFAFLLLVSLCICGAACAQTFVFDEISAQCEVSDSYIILTPDNLDEHPEWIANRGTTAETILAEWEEDGVLLEAWNGDGDIRFRITALQDEQAQTYFDLDQQTSKERAAFRTGHLKGTLYSENGITYQTAEWKKIENAGRVLTLKYKQSYNGETFRGYARRMVRNGYTITLDFRVSGRGLKTSDSKALVAIMSSWKFSSVADLPEEAAGAVTFTSEPPSETNTGEFSVEGTCKAGLTLVGVVMRMSSPDPIRVEDTAGSNGSFSLDVELEEEGIYLMTVTVLNGDTVVEEKVFDTTTYQKDLLPVNFDTEFPTQITGDELVISGKTIRNVSIQCIVGDVKKTVKTNATGKFSFTIDTYDEGTYDLVLVFEKKNYTTRRFTQTMTRELTEADWQKRYRDEAVKPAYSTLTSKLEGYTGRIMVYTLYVVSYEQSDTGWVITMAMNKKSGNYRNLVIVTTTEEPTYAVDSQVKLYARCTGAYTVTAEDGSTKSYPGFELLFWD